MIMKNEYAFLSNFYPCIIPLKINNEILNFNSTEAAFQACKDYSRSKEFCNLSPAEAKNLEKKFN